MDAGAILQIVTRGVNDIFLTGDPQITFFKTVYRRAANFSVMQKTLTFPARLNFGISQTIRIKRYGDLVNRLYLMVDIPDICLIKKPFNFCILAEILQEVGIKGTDVLNDESNIITYDNYK